MSLCLYIIINSNHFIVKDELRWLHINSLGQDIFIHLQKIKRLQKCFRDRYFRSRVESGVAGFLTDDGLFYVR